MFRPVALAAFAAVPALLSGCLFGHEFGCEEHEKAKWSRESAKMAYDGGHFDQAKTLYTNSIEQCSENYEARIGLANASRELGNQMFKDADQLARMGKIQPFGAKFKEANDNHVLAERLFRTAMTERPDDLDPHYGMGLFWYERCTNPLRAPWAPDDRVNRQRERDQAIQEFNHVISRFPQSSQSQRYLGLALLAADRIDEGAQHLKIYHDSRQDLYNKIVSQWPSLTEEEKKRKATALEKVEKEIDDVREVIVLEHGELMTRASKIQGKSRQDPGDAQEIAHLSSQQLILEGMIKSWGLTKLGEIEQVVVRRCREYLEAFNAGKLSEILPFLGARKGDETQLQQAVTAKVERGTQFRKVNFRTVVVERDTAKVGFACELVTSQTRPADSEVTLLLRLVGGQWLISDHP